jgi:DDE family transposase
MDVSAALKGRTRLAALLHQLEHEGVARGKEVAELARALDRRNRRTWRQLVLAVLVARSTRLLALGRVIAPQRRVRSVKAAAMALTYFLQTAQVAVPALSQGLLEAAVRQVDPKRLVTYRGKVLVVIDPTEYPKRSRGRGKCGRQMQYIGRVRKANGRGKGTTYGYVDIWAGLVLKKKQFLPLARRLFTSRHPHLTSQNQVEEAVLEDALALLRRLHLAAIVVGDRGLGRKELIIDLAKREQDLVLRVDPDITVYEADQPEGRRLDVALAAQPCWGEADWDRGQEGVLRCRLRVLRATIRFSRTGRKDDVQEATVTFVQAVPCEGPGAATTDPLVLATTLPVQTLAQARTVVRLYAQRWAIETGFETMHAWGQDAFMVRHWTAIDRLLWVLALAYALLVLALTLTAPPFRHLRAQAIAVLTRLSVVGDHLTVGKLAEAVGLDYQRHQRAWSHVWLS